MRGLKFVADDMENTTAITTVAALESAEDKAFALTEQGAVTWNGDPVAALAQGSDALNPDIKILAADFLPSEGEAEARARARLAAWVKAHIAEVLAPLAEAAATELTGAARDLAVQMAVALGQMPRRAAEGLIKSLSEDDRSALTKIGVRFGVETLYMPLALKPAQQELKSILWTVSKGLEVRPDMPVAGRVTFQAVDGVAPEFYEVLGYRVFGALVVRVDMLERFAAEIRHMTKDGPVNLPHDLLSILGIGLKEAKPLIEGLGYTAELTVTTEGEGEKAKEKEALNIARVRKAQRPPRKDAPPRPHKSKKPQSAAPPPKPRPEKKEKPIDPNSPFAVLKNLQLRK